MRVRQDDGVDPRRIDRKRRPVAIPQLFETLEEAAVDENPTVIDVEQMLGAGDGTGGSKKRERWRHGSALYSEDSPRCHPSIFSMRFVRAPPCLARSCGRHGLSWLRRK